MSLCPNCSASIGCSCKLRTTADGRTGCTICIERLEKTPGKTVNSGKTVITDDDLHIEGDTNLEANIT